MLEEDKSKIKNWQNREDILNIGDIVTHSYVDGPGVRFVIWVQGCPIRCKGCWNPHLWPIIPMHLIKVETLYKFILTFNDIDGITLVGGEPLYQSRALYNFVKLIKTNTTLTVMLYTGYNESEIKDKYAKELIKLSDIIVLGPYIEKERDIFLKWRGSRNQKIVFNNKQYEKLYSSFIEENEAEIHIDSKGNIVLIGFPDDELIREVKKLGESLPKRVESKNKSGIPLNSNN